MQPLWRTVLKKLKIELPYDPAIPHLSIYPKKPKTLNLKRYIYTPVFITASFTIAKKVFVAQSCLTLCYPMDCGLLDTSVHGMSQARILPFCFSRKIEKQPECSSRDEWIKKKWCGYIYIQWNTLQT